MNKSLTTRKGAIPFPAYIPVTTFGHKYPLDDLIRPYLPRLASAVMVSFHYARQMQQPLRIPMLVDSGGFASLFDNATVRKRKGLGLLEISGEDGTETLTPHTVLELQENIADVAFTLDFPIPPKMDKRKAHKRFELTLANAHWAQDNRRRKDLPLYACVQAWDADSARNMARTYAKSNFDGIAIGGLVPRARDKDTVLAITEAVKAETGDKPLHVFGMGKPEMVRELFKLGVDSVDSSAYVKLAAEGKTWDGREIVEPTGLERLRVALDVGGGG